MINHPIGEKWKERLVKEVTDSDGRLMPLTAISFIENLLEQERKRKDDILDCIIEDIDAWIPLDVTTDEIIELVRGFKEAIINK